MQCLGNVLLNIPLLKETGMSLLSFVMNFILSTMIFATTMFPLLKFN